MKGKLKSRNGGKWTEGRFRGFITSALRSAMRRWPPKWAVVDEAYVGRQKNKRTGREAKHYRCSFCKRDFIQKHIQVDHIIPIAPFKDWNECIEKMFCEADNLQVLCKPCHKKKTKIDNQANRKTARRKLRSKPSTDA